MRKSRLGSEDLTLLEPEERSPGVVPSVMPTHNVPQTPTRRGSGLAVAGAVAEGEPASPSSRPAEASRGAAAPKIFGIAADLWAVYGVTLSFRDKLVGGVPKDPNLIEGWLRGRAGIEDPRELQVAVMRTLDQIRQPYMEQQQGDEPAVLEAQPAQRRTTGFKLCEDGLFVEARQVKAMLKESTNIVFAGERWGPTRKASRSFFAERVFVEPDKILLGSSEPDGLETVVGHLSGPGGTRSTLGQYEYVLRPRLDFSVLVLRDCISQEQWRAIWCHAQENGFGTLRSQGHGRFDVVRWEPQHVGA
jgi:hypothetical protein